MGNLIGPWIMFSAWLGMMALCLVICLAMVLRFHSELGFVGLALVLLILSGVIGAILSVMGI